MTRPSHARSHVLACLALVAGLYVLGRLGGWTGPNSHVTFDNRVLIPGIVVITMWGIGRMLRRGSCDSQR